MLDALRGLAWPARHVVRTGATGTHQSRVRGPAPEFSEYRAFRQGDDPRRLDWKLLARTNRAYLRLTEDRATLATMLILDASPSMDFPASGRSKWTAAAEIAVGLAQVAHQASDPIGVLVPGVERGLLPPRTRRMVVSDITALLGQVHAGMRVGTLAPRPSHLAPFLTLVRVHAGRLPSRVVFLSDFLDDDGTVPSLVSAHVASGGEVHAVRMIAREELDLPSRGFTAVDPEDDGVARPFAPGARDGYLERFRAWGDDVAARWRQAGAFWTDVVSDELPVAAVRRVVGAGT